MKLYLILCSLVTLYFLCGSAREDRIWQQQFPQQGAQFNPASPTTDEPRIILEPGSTASYPDPNAPPGTSSLTFVFDVTGSMYDDLVQVREGAKRIFATVLEQREKLIHNYVLVPFHDPEVGPVVATSDTQYFQKKLQNLYVQGGGDCPEMAISGVKLALEASLPSSFIYVFTDARAKDYQLTDQVLNLIQDRQSQVVFVMTGDCGNRSHPGYKAFERIASTSSGQVFHLEKSDVNEVLNYVRVAVQTRKVHISSVDRNGPGSFPIEIPIDTYLHEFTVSLSGDDPEVQLVDPSAQVYREGSEVKPILDLGNAIIYNVLNPKPGVWRLRATSKSKHTVRITGLGEIAFTHGFAPRLMGDVLRAHYRPLQSVMTYLMVNVTGLLPPGLVNQIGLVDLEGNTLYKSPATMDSKNPFLYHVGPFIPPNGYYFVKVNGVDDRNFEFQRISSTAINPQTATGPRPYMPARTLAHHGQSANLTCNIESRTPFTLYWYKAADKIGGPFYFQYSDAAFWTLTDVTPADAGEYKCAVVSTVGNDTAITTLETKDAPPNIIAPRNVTATLGSTAQLHCRTRTPGPSTITWQRKGIPIQSSAQFTVFPNGTLNINPISKSDEGGYVCHVITGGGSARAEIYVSVLEAPKAAVFPSSLYFVERGAFNISCAVTGDPQPEGHWLFNNEHIRPSGKHYVSYKHDLLVRGAMKEDQGRYECRATSPYGIASDYATVKMAEPPQVMVKRDKEMIGRGDSVTLECQVSAGVPEPTISWYRGGREVTAFRYITIQNGRLTIQSAQDADAGMYTCMAENIAGRAESRIRVDVGSEPSIVPSPDTVTVNIERDVTLHCRATGHPTPEVSWTKDGVSVKTSARHTLLPDGGLQIRKSTLEDVGRYICTASNRFGQRDAVRTLLVSGLVSPVLVHVSAEEQVLEGGALRLSCVVVLGIPQPALRWFKDGRPLKNTANAKVNRDGSELSISGARVVDEGRYMCVATNPAGNATLAVSVNVITKPVIASGPPVISAKAGERMEIPCKAKGKPAPTITWTKDGRPLLQQSTEHAIKDDGTLVVYVVRPADAGTYQCNVANSAGESSRSVKVNVRMSPKISPDQPNYTVKVGERLIIPCEAVGEPKPSITWTFNGKPVKLDHNAQHRPDGSLLISRAKEEHRGEFRCTAKNNVGQDVRVVIVNVYTAPVILGSGEVRTITVRVNETVRLQCPARADPPPTREWTFEGRNIYAGFIHGSEFRISKDGLLEIMAVRVQNAGRYTCLVSNVAGNDSISYVLKVEEPPRIISDIPSSIDTVLGTKLDLPCRAVGNPTPTTSWQKDGFHITSGKEYVIERGGTLRITEALVEHAGKYTCTAKNAAGVDSREVTVAVQKAPRITASTLTSFTAVQGERVELRCTAEGLPQPEIQWYRQGTAIRNEKGMRIFPDGRLIIESAKGKDQGPYVCKAVNPAGEASQDIMLTVVVPPTIPDQTISKEEVLLGAPFTLYCPVSSSPIPKVSWYLHDKPVAEADKNIQMSDDKRRLHVLKARVKDAGNYKCVARNAAGQSSKPFKVEVLVPPMLDESKQKRKVTVIVNQAISISCPVTGVPKPAISWMFNGQLLQAGGPAVKGIQVTNNGNQLKIASSQLDHEGTYTCVATNKAGSLDVDVILSVLAPPHLGEDEVMEVVRGAVVTMNCNPRGDGPKSSVIWMKGDHEAEGSGSTVQIALEGRKLYINRVEPSNGGKYTCIVRNTAGESRKNFQLIVLVPPEFRKQQYDPNFQVPEGRPLTLTCSVSGSPNPKVSWEKDGQKISTNSLNGYEISEDGVTLKIREMYKGLSSRFTCMAKNKAGAISRDFFVQSITRPLMQGGERIRLEVVKGSSTLMECPIASSSSSSFQIEWTKDARNLPENQANFQLSLDRQRLHMANVQEEDEGLYMCIARNPAGRATQEFQLVVLTPPKILGNQAEQIEILEGQPLTMRCQHEADPLPKVKWLKDGIKLPSKAQVLSDNVTVYISSTGKSDGGTYFCTVENKAGVAEKTFQVRVVLKPTIGGGDANVEVPIGQSVTLDCPVSNAQDVEIEWLHHERPLKKDTNFQILASGRHLNIVAARRSDVGRFSCVAKNKAGSTAKRVNLVVLVPPTIKGESGEHSVVVNQSLTLPCESDGVPKPTITWTKSGADASKLSNVQILSGGQQFRITSATQSHSGQYICTATNKLATADVRFDVDVIAPPALAESVKDTIEVLVNHSTTLRCPVSNGRYTHSIMWMRDRRPLATRGNPKYIESQNGRKLHVSSIQLADEGTYSCRVKNRAGETTIDYKLIVLEPPKILILDKDKNQTIPANGSILLSCPASGKPDPEIKWYKEGEQLTTENLQQRIPGSQILANTLRIPRIQTRDGGRYTCFAQNKAGLAEQDIIVYVITPPRIEREGIPSTIQAVLGQRATISCPVYGRPTPVVTWLKAGRPLVPTDHIYYSANKQKLHFVSLSKTDLDQYSCVAQNPAGEDKRDFRLDVLVAPSIAGMNLPRHIQVIIGRSALLECPAVGSPEPTIAWMKNGQPVREGGRIRTLNGGKQLQISGAQLDDTARYNCIASNQIGVVDLDTFVDVVGPPSVTGNDLDVVEVVESQAATLVCDITGSEPLDMEWLKNGQSLTVEGPKGAYIQIAYSGRRLHILAAQTSDEGRYICVGRNRAGEARKTFDLRVFVPPTINDTLSSPPIQKASLGHSFRIECKASGNPLPQIAWYKDGSAFAPDPNDPLVKILYDNQTIWFARVADAHGGRYVCVATNKVGSAEKDFILQLKGPPQLDQPLVVKEANVGDYVMLPCTIISGGGRMQVNWLMNERPVEEGNATDSNIKIEDKRLEIREARLSDTGRYTCLVRNEAGEAKKHFDLSILEPPRFLDTRNLAPSIVEGRQLLLDCSVRGTPKPSVTWTKDGQELASNSDGQFINDNQQYRVADAVGTDAGRYTCTAENKAGRAEKDVIVNVQMPPKIASTYSVTEAVENDTITLECPVNNGDAQIQWSRNGVAIAGSNYIQVASSGLKLHLTRVQTSNAGRYTCLARNEAGQASMDIDVVVLVPPKIHGASFRTVEGVVNQTMQMECRVSGVPEPTIEWTKDGKPLSLGPHLESMHNGSFLRLNFVQSPHEGRYSCVATNKVGRAEADTFVQVIAPPSIVKSQTEMQVMLGQNQIIRCDIHGNPTPTVSWLKNGQPLDSALVGSSVKNHYVHIVDAKLTNAGRYTCVAKSRAGEDRHTTNLIVLVPPTILTGERILNVIENRSLVIECLADGTPEPVLKWYKDGKLLSHRDGDGRRHNGHNYQISENRLMIYQAQLSDAGRYTCEAESAGAGSASVDFAVDVYVRPYFIDLVKEIRVVESEKVTLDCKVEAKPPAQLTWLRGGRPLDMKSTNLILSPRGHRLIILSTKRGDAGTYSCVAKNAAGENEATFEVTVLVPPHIVSPIDQNPKAIVKQNATIECPVVGIPMPKVEWRKDGQPIARITSPRYFVDTKVHTLRIFDVEMSDKGRYTCHASNEAGVLDTDYVLDINAPPKFGKPSLTEYEVTEGQAFTLDCQAEAEPKPDIVWLKGDSAVYLDKTIWLSADSQQLTISHIRVSDGGRYTCKATNIAGTKDVDMVVHVLVPPTIDKSNIIGNPLAIVNKTISIECLASGAPAPSVSWLKDGQPLPRGNSRISYAYGNQTLKIDFVLESDAGRYTCVAKNKAGAAEQDFNLEVLTPPVMETAKLSEQHTLTEKDSLTLVCPVVQSGTQPADITWTKDGRPLDTLNSAHVTVSHDNRRLHIATPKLSDSGVYNCIASNRAGETQMEFRVDLMSEPHIDGSRNDPQPHVIDGQPQTLWCLVTGRPHPTITWLKDGVPLNAKQTKGFALIERDQGLRIEHAGVEDAGRYTCVAKNAAGTEELEIVLDVWIAPAVKVSTAKAAIPLGQSLTLLCHASGNPQPRLQWTKDGQALSSGARVSMNGARLDIVRVRMDDTGRYTCGAVNEAGTAEDYTDIDVLLPPVIRRDGIDVNPRVPLGQMLTMTCEAEGKPSPQITWYKDGQAMKSNEKVTIAPGGIYIQINVVSISDKGLYRCLAVNDAGDDYVVYNVDIIQLPVIGPGGTVQVVENQTAVMDCDSSAVPPPIIHWLRNGHRIVNKDRYQVANKTLIISMARSVDAGIYVCVSTNDIGMAQQAYTLEVLVPPKIVPKTAAEAAVAQGKSFELNCVATGYPPPQIVWYKGTSGIEPSEKYLVQTDGTLSVADADATDEGPYKCIAANAAGKDERQYQVLIIQPPTIAERDVRVMNVTEGTPLALVCQVQSDPQPHITWYKDGVQFFGAPQGTRLSFEQESTRLQIAASRLTDSGNYSCEAANPAGNVTQRFVVHVGSPPRITDEVRRIVVANGSRTDLPCEAVGHPSPTIEWTIGATRVPESRIRGNTVVFSQARPQDAGKYTCIARNWVSTATKDVELIVLSRPQIVPEHSNLTVKANGTAVFTCNATGATGILAWFKEPNLPIVSNNRFSIENDSLRIYSVKQEDAGYYRCVAKNEAGAAVGFRRLTVESVRPMRVVWVPCDEKGKPIRESYVPARGDTPSTNQQWLPWSSESAEFPENGTDGTILKCLPNEQRRQRNQGTVPEKPMLIELPKNHDVRLGGTLTLSCGAIGLPPPEIFWLHNNSMMSERPPIDRGRSVLKIDRVEYSHGGSYMCMAKNQHGSTRAAATVRIRGPSHYLQTEGSKNDGMQVVSILNCKVPSTVSSKVQWVRDGRVVTSDNSRIHVLDNGTLVLTGFQEEEIKQFSCIHDKKHMGVTVAKKAIHEKQPVVMISPRQYQSQIGDNIAFHCQLAEGHPLTTQITWYHNRLPIITSDRIDISSNKSLAVANIESSDRGEYRCVASNSRGRAYAAAGVIIPDVPYEARSQLSGDIDGVRFMSAPIRYNLSRAGQQSEIHVHIDALPLNLSSGVKAMLGLAATPCWILTTPTTTAADINQLTKGHFDQTSRYDFGSGETVQVRNRGHGVSGGFLVMETVINGNLPAPLQQRREIIAMEPYVEFLVPSAPGCLYGYGNGLLRVGPDDSVPLSWQHNVSFDTNGQKLPFATEKIRVFDINFHDTRSERRQRYDFSLRTAAEVASRCPKGFEMPDQASYCADVDECNAQLAQCDQSQDCINTVGSYRCVSKCSQGFTRNENGQCVDVDECILLEKACRNACQYGCYNYPGAFYCHCPPGYVRYRLSTSPINFNSRSALYTAFWLLTTAAVHVGSDFCSDIDECKGLARCNENQECVNTAGGYWCKEPCQTGFQRNEHGACVDTDECLQLIPCHPDQTCVNTPGSFQCHCPAGLVADGQRSPCQDIDECALQPPVCSHGCENTKGSYVCSCPSGYVLTKDGRTCNAIDFGLADSAPFDSSEADQTSLAESSGCPEGSTWNGQFCQATNCGPSKRCQYQCQATSNGDNACTCPAGYRLAPDGYSCADIDECKGNIAGCSSGSMCFNERGSYRCLRITCPVPYAFSIASSSCLLPCNGDPSGDCANRPRRIKVETVSLPNGVAAFRDVLRLMAFDGQGRQLRRAHFSLTAADASQDESQFPPFAIRLVNGRGTVFTVRKLSEEKLYKLKVHASSYDDVNPSVKYQTEFIIFISVSRFPF